MFNESRNPVHRKKKLFLVPVIILLFFGLTAAVQFLWNAVLPDALHASPLTYWQAAGLLVLCKILFGSFHFGRRGHGDSQFRNRAHQMHEKWTSMTDEERVQFKERLRDRCRHRR